MLAPSAGRGERLQPWRITQPHTPFVPNYPQIPGSSQNPELNTLGTPRANGIGFGHAPPLLCCPSLWHREAAPRLPAPFPLSWVNPSPTESKHPRTIPAGSSCGEQDGFYLWDHFWFSQLGGNSQLLLYPCAPCPWLVGERDWLGLAPWDGVSGILQVLMEQVLV